MSRRIYTKDMTVEEVIDRLQKGEVIRYVGDSSVKKLINGVIVDISEDMEEKYTIINASFDIKEDCWYFEDTEPFQITETGLYKTRDGRKAFVSQIELNYDESAVSRIYGTVDNEIEIFIWSSNGRRGIAESNYDIVAKWSE